jgi:hypothetical protein
LRICASEGLTLNAIIFQPHIFKAGFFLYLHFLDKNMLIERTNNNQITITVSSGVDSFGLQRLIDYVKYLEATAKSKAKQSDVDKLADQVNASWWTKNRKRFIK